jgi:hypothetical protein
MPLTSRQAFKVAFLHRCVDQGLSTQEIRAVVKQAAERLEKVALLDVVKWLTGMGSDVGHTGLDLAKTLAVPAVGAALLAPPALGLAGGYAASKLTDVSDADPADIKLQEKKDAYRRAAQLARSQAVQALQRDVVAGRRNPRSLI